MFAGKRIKFFGTFAVVTVSAFLIAKLMAKYVFVFSVNQL